MNKIENKATGIKVMVFGALGLVFGFRFMSLAVSKYVIHGDCSYTVKFIISSIAIGVVILGVIFCVKVCGYIAKEIVNGKKRKNGKHSNEQKT